MRKKYRVKASKDFSGLWRNYDITGKVATETAYENGIKNGLKIIYFDNGSPSWIKYYLEGAILEIRGYNKEGYLNSKKTFNKKGRAEWERIEKKQSTTKF